MRKLKLLAAALVLALLTAALSSCFNGNERVLFEIDGYGVTYEVYRYVALNARSDIEGKYGENVWDSDERDTAFAELEENIKSTLVSLYTVCSLGRDYGTEWNDDSILAAVRIAKNELLDEYDSEEEFSAALDEVGMTDGAFEFIKANSLLIDELYTAVAYSDERNTDEEYLRELFMSDSFIRVKQILVGGENAGTDEQNLEIAEGIMKKLKAGADFDKLCREYNNDLYMFNNDAGYYITRGTRDSAFEDAAFSLELGEVSDIVKTASGYSIIKRCEKDKSYIEENFVSLTDEYFETLYTAAYEEKYVQLAETVTSLPDSIDILELE